MTASPVTLLTTPGCADCHAIRSWLEQHDVPFHERDLSDPDVRAEAKRRYGVRVAPITVVGNEVLYGTADRQIPLLRGIFGGEGPVER